MKKIITISSKNSKKILALAAKHILKGELVAFPTETVYGLGANALDPEAVRKIFRAKGRPMDNPLIVHIAEKKDLKLVTGSVPPTAQLLIEKFWPGPLTLVLKKRKSVPSEVTAGSDTVAVRMPVNIVARALIRAAGMPIAAPSANLAGKPSPTTAQHVAEDLSDEVALILDGGKTKIGLESTVVDVTGPKLVILRSGHVTSEKLAAVLGYVPSIAHAKKGKPVKSPGMKYRHYAPAVPMELFLPESFEEEKFLLAAMQKKLQQLQAQGKRVGVLCALEHAKMFQAAEQVVNYGSQKKPREIGQKLFSCLRRFHPSKVDLIVAEGISKKGFGHAIMDRLQRATGG